MRHVAASDTELLGIKKRAVTVILSCVLSHVLIRNPQTSRYAMLKLAVSKVLALTIVSVALCASLYAASAAEVPPLSPCVERAAHAQPDSDEDLTSRGLEQKLDKLESEIGK
jgi:hypothetical protein